MSSGCATTQSTSSRMSELLTQMQQLYADQLAVVNEAEGRDLTPAEALKVGMLEAEFAKVEASFERADILLHVQRLEALVLAVLAVHADKQDQPAKVAT